MRSEPCPDYEPTQNRHNRSIANRASGTGRPYNDILLLKELGKVVDGGVFDGEDDWIASGLFHDVIALGAANDGGDIATA